MANNVKVVSDASLQAVGFSAEEIAGASGNGYVGERGGFRYFRAQQDINIELGEYKTRSVAITDQQGDPKQ